MHATFEKIISALCEGKVIVATFGERIEDFEVYPENGMKARIEACRRTGDGCVMMVFDYTEFDRHNAALESANYYDKMGVPCLTARQAGMYSATGDPIYFEADEDPGEYFQRIAFYAAD